MELKPLKKLTGLEYNLSKTVQYTEEFCSQFIQTPFLTGIMATISITSASTTFNHNLNIIPNGWIVVDQDANANIWKTGATTSQITFTSSANVNAKIWIF